MLESRIPREKSVHIFLGRKDTFNFSSPLVTLPWSQAAASQVSTAHFKLSMPLACALVSKAFTTRLQGRAVMLRGPILQMQSQQPAPSSKSLAKVRFRVRGLSG